eukprot:scaffold43208_cov74-Phaeocystis_antarctica.AAC.9
MSCSTAGLPERPPPTGAQPLPLWRWQACVRLAIFSLPLGPRAHARLAPPCWKCPGRGQQWPQSALDARLASVPHRQKEAYSARCSHRMVTGPRRCWKAGSDGPKRCSRDCPRSLAESRASVCRIPAHRVPIDTLRAQQGAWACLFSGQCLPSSAFACRCPPH